MKIQIWESPARWAGGLPSVGSQRVGHDWHDLAAAAALAEIMGIEEITQKNVVEGEKTRAPRMEAGVNQQ